MHRAVAPVAAGAAALLFAGAAALAAERGAAPDLLVFAAAGLPALAIGAAIAHRQPDIGLLVVLVGAAPVADAAVQAWGGSSLPGAAVAAAIGTISWMWLYTPPILLALLYPDGRVTGRRWAVAAACAVALPVLQTVLAAAGDLVPVPVQDVAMAATLLSLLLLLVAAVLQVVGRYRRADETGRRRIRWFAVTSALLPSALVVCWIEYLLVGTVVLVGVLLMGLFVLLPASIGVAMLRHELYGVDRLLAGTVRWAVVVAAVGAVFAVSVVVVGALLGADALAAALAAVLATSAVRPLHRSARRAVDRRFQPRRTRALEAVEAHVAAVRKGAAPEDLEPALQRALTDPELRVGPDGVVPGAVPLTAKDVADLDAASVLPRELTRLRRDLRDALAATAASRGRILEAADAERARIERDLHDGAQQQLVAVGIRLRSVQRAAPEALQRDLGEAVTMVQTSIAELRRLAQGIRPAALDDGLGPALRSMVRTLPVPVDLDIEAVEVREPSATTAYYVVAEAVTNALKHAGARRIRIALSTQEEGFRLEISDDGRGGAAVRPGGGLAGLTDRLDALGGRIHVAARAGGGTLVTAVLP